MILIAAVDRNWAIGSKGKLLANIPNDMKRFRELTEGNIIIAGRRTLQTFPGGLPLPNRINLILSKDPILKIRNAEVTGSVSQAIEFTKEYPDKEVFVVGGENVYSQMLPYCSTAFITHIDHEYAADAYLENLDKSLEWTLSEESEEQTCFDLEYTFRIYKRRYDSP